MAWSPTSRTPCWFRLATRRSRELRDDRTKQRILSGRRFDSDQLHQIYQSVIANLNSLRKKRTYNENDNESLFCINVGSLSFGGPASISIAQAGTAVASSLIFKQALDVQPDGFGGCLVVDAPDEVLPLYGQLTNNTLTLLLPLGGGVSDLFTVTFAGDTITGTLTDSFGDLAMFNVTKSAVVAGPRRRAVRP